MTDPVLPRMQAHWGPYWPMPQKNLTWFGRFREDLDDDVQVHFYNHGYWTLEELHKYGALPPLPPK